VVTTASHAQTLPDPSGHKLPGNDERNARLLLVNIGLTVHGKEKVYGSIP
jgi:hypothetical protein